jgi:hypothetical protein
MPKTQIYTGTQINDSAVLAFPAAEEIADVRCKAIVLTADGAKVATGATAPFMGMALITNDFPIKKGEDVHVQIKEVGLVAVGTAVTAGAAVTADAEGKVKPAADGDYVLGIATQNGEAGDRVYIQVAKYKG